MVKLIIEGFGEIVAEPGLSIYDIIAGKDKAFAKKAILAEIIFEDGTLKPIRSYTMVSIQNYFRYFYKFQ